LAADTSVAPADVLEDHDAAYAQPWKEDPRSRSADCPIQQMTSARLLGGLIEDTTNADVRVLRHIQAGDLEVPADW
jgi:hypothetical protein